uniref:Uncharacterized protein n=1 Tax=Timema genevievae TaxID=629358 RepID=A0A7R9JVB9_TIMGE|nr:unnamed protein product [Timema genevievae]
MTGLYSFGQGEATNTSLQRYSYRDFCLNDASLWKVGEHYVLLLIRAIRLNTNYANGLGIGKVEYKGIHPNEIRTSISPSLAVELNTTSALDNYATEAVSLADLLLERSNELAQKTSILCGFMELDVSAKLPSSFTKEGLIDKNRTRICVEGEWKTTWENHPHCIQPGSNTNLPIFGSLVYHESSALDYSVTEAGLSNTSCSDNLRISHLYNVTTIPTDEMLFVIVRLNVLCKRSRMYCTGHTYSP